MSEQRPENQPLSRVWQALNDTQQGVWLAEQLADAPGLFTVAHYLALPLAIDLPRMLAAIREGLATADCVTAHYATSGERANWTAHVPDETAILWLDLSEEPDPQHRARQWMQDDLAASPSADSGQPLYRHCLFRLGKGESEHWWWYQRYHHISVDGYSFAALTRRILACYSDRDAGQQPGFTPFGEVLAEYASYQDSDRYRQDQAFWQGYLADWPQPASLSRAEGQPAAANLVLWRERICLDGPAYDALLALASAERVAMPTVLMAMIAAYLARMSDEPHAIFGLPMMRRMASAAVRAVGPMVNVLPVRLPVPATAALPQTARALHDLLKQLRRHEKFDGNQLTRLAGQGSQRLFASSINLRIFEQDLQLDGTTLANHLLAAGPVDDIEFAVWLQGDALHIELSANPARYRREEVAAHALRLQHFMQQWLAAPEQPLARQALCSPAEQAQVQQWSRGAEPVAGDDYQTILDALSQVARQHPARLALAGLGEALDFASLHDKVGRMANLLRSAGVVEGELVALGLPRSQDSVVAMLAIMVCGAAYLPLDISQPAARLADICADAAPRWLLARRGSLPDDLLPARACLWLDEVQRAAQLAAQPATWPVCRRTAANLAYVLYTSGSTGKPKGVMVSHGGLLNLLRQHRDGVFASAVAQRGTALRALHTTAFTFDASWELLLCLLCGHSVWLADEEQRRDAQTLASMVGEQRIDVIDVPPSLLQQLLDAGLMAGEHRPALIMVGSEAVPPALWTALRAYPDCRVHNFYGPTEYTIDAVSTDLADSDTPVIGRPLAHTRAYVLDSQLQLLPPGVTGELYLAGAGTALGYLAQAALTAARFVANPYAVGERLYRTGDLVRWRETGQLEFIGRRDHQVKVRGFRIELGDVEHALASLPGVAAAVVLAEAAGNSQRLLAYCTLQAGEHHDSSRLMAMLAARLPDYMLPAALQVLARWPQTANGKIDRRALPRPQTVERSAGRVAQGAAETLLCQTMQQVLSLDTVGADEDFFALGGDSISAMALGSRLRQAGFQLRPRDIFALRSAERMAGAMQPLASKSRARVWAGKVDSLPILRWFDSHYGVARRYVQAVVLAVPAQLDAIVLAEAMYRLQQAHPALAARWQDGGLDIVAKPGLGEGMISQHGEVSDVDALLSRAAGTLSAKDGRLWHASLFTHEGQPCLQLAIHHLVVDGVSWRVLLPELASLCTQLWQDQPIVLPVEETSLAEWQASLLASLPSRVAELPHWQAMLAPDTAAGARRALDSRHDHYDRAGQQRTLLDAALTETLLVSLPALGDASSEEWLLTLLALALRDLSGSRRLPFTLESHGRHALADGEDLARTVGWLTAEYPLTITLPPEGDDLPAALRAVKQVRRAASEQGLGYGLLRWLDTVHGPALAAAEAARPASVLFNYLGRFDSQDGLWQPLALGGKFADTFAVELEAGMGMLHPLELNIFVAGDTLALNWTWAEGVYLAEDIAFLHEAMQAHGERLQALLRQHSLALADTLVAADTRGSAGQPLSESTLSALRARHGALAAVLPVLPLQQGLLFHALLGEAASNYNSTTRLDFDGELHLPRLQAALAAVLRKHPQLAARFDSDSGDALQLLPLQTTRWPWRESDIRDIPPEAQAAELARLEHQVLAQRFAIGQPGAGPLLDALLVRRGQVQYSLFLTAHHLVVDGWSTPILLHDFLCAYREGAEVLRPTRVPYAEVVASLAARPPEPARQAWQQALTGAWPTCLYQGQSGSDRVHEYALPLPATLAASLTATARRHGLTFNTLLQGAWAGLLSLLCGRDDVMFGSPVSGRFAAQAGIDEHIGLFSNTLPVRMSLRPDMPLLAQLPALQARQIVLLEHDNLGLADIQQLAGGQTLFDTLLVVENYPDDGSLQAADYHGARLSGLRNRGHTHYPLTLLALPGEQTTLLFEYREQVGDIAVLAERLLGLLTYLAADDGMPWSQYDGRTLAERAQQAAINATGVVLPAMQTLPAWLAAQATLTPQAAALADADVRFDYCQMRAQVRALAMRLQEAGIRRGDVVAVALPRSVKLTLALHAIVELGAAYLPLDTAYPDERLAYMVQDAKPGLLICDAAQQHRFAALADLLLFDTLADAAMLAASEDWQARDAARPDDAAYLLYTSGSTGRPKGVQVPHRAIVNRLLWMQHQYPLAGHDVVLQKTPSSFDVSVWEFFWPLMCGAQLYMAAPDAHRDPEALLALLQDETVSTLHFVPSMLSAFVAHLQALPVAARVCPALARVFCSGEALSRELAAQWQALMNVPLHNLYGPTEAAVDVSYKQAGEDGDSLLAASVPIGKPVWNTRLYILDQALRPVPMGVAGELYLSGVQLAHGYRGRPALTAGRFVADPFVTGERMYRTGDIARYLPGGDIEYLGRSDDQLKIRGQRIELGEIDSVLASLPGVAQAVCHACVLGQTAGDVGADARQLVGYVVASDATAVLQAEVLRQQLAERLPAHMVPVAIVFLPALPLSANGKLDRKSLPLPQQTVTGGRPPAPGLESLIAGVFARLLQRETVLADDDFFALGGHSLLAMRLAAELRRELGTPLAVGQVLLSRSVAALAQAISGGTASDTAGFDEVLALRAGEGPALFCLHPASGFAWQYSALLSYLPAGMPVIGLQSPRPEGALAGSADLDAMCDRLLASVRRLQPQGPYRLLGYSLGGIVAVGLAARLQAAGETVSQLLLLDASPPELQDWDGLDENDAQAEIAREQAMFMSSDDDDDSLRAEKQRMFADIVANYDDAVRLLSKARTARYDGAATLFVARQSVPAAWDVAGSWQACLPQLQIVDCDSRHEDMLSPPRLLQLGPWLAAALA